jgi:hypothetical protein
MSELIKYLELEGFLELKSEIIREGYCDISEDGEFLTVQSNFIDVLHEYLFEMMGWSALDGEGALYLSGNLWGATCLTCELDVSDLGVIPRLKLKEFLGKNCPDYSIYIPVWQGGISKIGDILISLDQIIATSSLEELVDW